MAMRSLPRCFGYGRWNQPASVLEALAGRCPQSEGSQVKTEARMSLNVYRSVQARRLPRVLLVLQPRSR